MALEETKQNALSNFESENYDKAIFYFSLLLENEPSNEEYKLFVILSDLAKENKIHAKNLFEYYMLTEDELKSSAIEYIYSIIDTIDDNTEKLVSLLQEFNNIETNFLNAIDYDDFLNLVAEKNSFKEAFEDIMFSTKVAIKSQSELLDFIEQLIENGYSSIAEEYLDGVDISYTPNNQLTRIYKKLGKTESIGNKTIEKNK